MSSTLNARSPDPNITAAGAIGVIWMEVVLALACVVFRLWVRISGPRSDQKKFRIDDCWVIFAFMCFLAMSVCHSIILPTIWTLYRVVDGKEVPPPDFASTTKVFLYLEFVIIILFWSCIWAVKASFLTFYKPLFEKQVWQPCAWWMIVILCALSYIGNWVLQFLACSPLASYFILGGCESSRDIYISNISLYYSTAVDALCDFLIMVLPLTLLWKLQLSTSKKVALGGLFSAGLVIIAFAILRLVLTLPGQNRHVNPKWLALMSSTEACIAVIVSCAPPFKVFLNRRQVHTSPRRSPTFQASSSESEGRKSMGIRLKSMKFPKETTASRNPSESTEAMISCGTDDSV